MSPAPESLVALSVAHDAPFTFTAGMPLAGVAPALVTGGALDPEAKEITWGTPAKCWLPGGTVAALKDLIKGRGSTVRVEVARYCKAGSGAHDTAFSAYRSIAPIFLDDLLNPGATEASGQALLKPPFDLGGGAQNSCLPSPPAEAPDGTKPIEEEALPEGATSAWTSATSASLTFTLTLSKPLLAPFKPPAPTEMSVADLLPQREPLAPLVAPDTATEAFKAEVLSAAGTLSKEYATMFTGEPLDDGGKLLRRKGLVFELNRSGKYHAMKVGLALLQRYVAVKNTSMVHVVTNLTPCE